MKRSSQAFAATAPEAIPTRLAQAASALAETFAPVDQRFLNVGSRLGATIDTFGRLSAIFEALPQQVNSGQLHDAAARLRDIAADVTAMGADFAQDRTALERLLTLNREVKARIGGFHQSYRSISILAVNAQVTAAGIDAKGEDLSIFTEQIMGLAKRASAAADAAAGESETLEKLLSAAFAIHSTFEADHASALQGLSDELDANLRKMDDHREGAGTTTDLIRRRSEEIGREIGVVVMALQFSDITRQRIEHIASAVASLARGLDPHAAAQGAQEPWCAGLDEAQSHAIAAQACELQRAQLDHAADEFEREVGRVSASLSKLVDDATDLVRMGSRAYAADDASEGSFLDDLKTNLNAMSAIMQQCQEASGSVEHSIEDAIRSVHVLRDVVSSVRAVEADIHLVGLNTTLKCGRIGRDGRVLSVIAQELRACAKRSVDEIATLIAVLQDIAATASRFERDDSDKSASRIAALEQHMSESLTTFQDSAAHLNRALEDLGGTGDTVSPMLQEAANDIAICQDVGLGLREIGGWLEGLAGELKSRSGGTPGIPDRVRYFMHDRYTMASQREIHSAMVAGSSKAAAASAAPSPGPASSAADSPGEDALDDILF